MPIDWRRRERVERFDHGGPIRYVSLSPVAGVVLVVPVLEAIHHPSRVTSAAECWVEDRIAWISP